MDAKFIKPYIGKDVNIAIPHKDRANELFYLNGRIIEMNEKEGCLIFEKNDGVLQIDFSEVRGLTLKR